MKLHQINKVSWAAIATLLLLALVITFMVYKPGLLGTFVFDDSANITSDDNLAIKDINFDTLKRAALSNGSGPLKRPVSMLSFAANCYFTGFSPYYFKMTNLAIHLVNGLGIFTLSFLLLAAYRRLFEPLLSTWQIQSISVAVAAAWLLHPFNLTSVLYVVQRMTSLSALFVIAGLCLFVWGRIRMLEGKAGHWAILASVLVFTPLAALSKETGALAPAFMLVIEIVLFRFQTVKSFDRTLLICLFATTIALPAIVVLVFLILHPTWLAASYVGRSFTLAERLMTEPRVIWFYLRQIALPNISSMGLFHDDIPNSTGLLVPVTTLFSIIGIVVLFVAAWLLRNKAPIVTFGILFFFCGHALESTAWPLEITHEHRNYLPMFGVLLPLFFYLLYPLKFANNLPFRRVVALLLIALFAYDTSIRAIAWANPFELAKSEVENHPNSARDNGEMGNNYAAITVHDAAIAEAYYQKARHYYEQSAFVDPNYTNGLIDLIILSAANGKDIDPKWIDELEHRLRFSAAEPDTGNKLQYLVTCEIRKKCTLGRKTLHRLYDAALDNPTVIGSRRALVLSTLSYMLIDIDADYPAAISALNQSIEASPQQFEYRLTLTKVLAALLKTDDAKKQLLILERMDTLHTHEAEIGALEKQLAAQEIRR